MRRRQLSAILTAAAELFATKGYHETTMQDIAEAAGMQKATLYHYINTKESLLTELSEQAFRIPLADARRIVSLPITPRDKLREWVYKYVSHLTANQNLATIFFRERANLPPEQRERLLAVSGEMEAYVAEIIGEGQATGYFRHLNGTVVRQSIFGMTNWIVQWYRPDGSLTPAAIADWMVDLLLGGLCEGPSQIPG